MTKKCNLVLLSAVIASSILASTPAKSDGLRIGAVGGVNLGGGLSYGGIGGIRLDGKSDFSSGSQASDFGGMSSESKRSLGSGDQKSEEELKIERREEQKREREIAESERRSKATLPHTYVLIIKPYPEIGYCVEVDVATKGKRFSNPAPFGKCPVPQTIKAWKSKGALEGDCIEVAKNGGEKAYWRFTDQTACKPAETTLLWTTPPDKSGKACYEVDSKTGGRGGYSYRIDDVGCAPSEAKCKFKNVGHFDKEWHLLDAETNGSHYDSVVAGETVCDPNGRITSLNEILNRMTYPSDEKLRAVSRLKDKGSLLDRIGNVWEQNFGSIGADLAK